MHTEAHLKMRDDEERVLSLLRELFEKHRDSLRGYRVVLFGSRAAGNARDRSDFDVGVIGNAPLPLQVFHAIGEDIDNLATLYPIDWVDLNRASDDFRKQALNEGKVIYET